MDDRFIRSSSPPPLTPVRKAATNPPAQPSARQDQPSIVRPNPPVSASLTAPPASGTTSTPPPKKTESTTGKEKPEAKPDPEIDPDAVTVVKEKSPATNPPPKKEEKSLEKIDEAARQYPAATATGKDGIVLSPFPPHEELDVTGMKTGDLAIDPGNGRIFRVP